MDRACCRALADLFCELLPSVILLVFLLVSAAIGNKNYCKFNSLYDQAIAGQGHQLKLGWATLLFFEGLLRAART